MGASALKPARRLARPRFDEEIENLREQFYVTLRAYLAKIEISAQPSPALTRVRELLEPGRRPRWSDCYEIEQLLVHLFDDGTLRTELEVRLLEAQLNLSPRLSEFYRNEAKAADDDIDRKRELLARLVNDLQWRYTVQEGKRRFSKSLTTRSAVAFLVALSAFITLVFVAYRGAWEFTAVDARLLYAAGVAGAWGATFSMLTGLQSRIEASAIYDLNVMQAVTMVVARTLVGAGAACVLYLLFASGMLAGSAFPDLASGNGLFECVQTKKSQCLKPSTLSLVMVWCFIAGFFEKLVPTLLAKVDAKVGGSSPSGDDNGAGDRYRPIATRKTEPKGAPAVPPPPAEREPARAAPMQEAEQP